MHLRSHCTVFCMGWKFINSFGHTSIASKWLPNKPQWSRRHQSSYRTAFRSNVEPVMQRFRIKSHSHRNLSIEFISLQVLSENTGQESAQAPHSALYQSVKTTPFQRFISRLHLRATEDDGAAQAHAGSLSMEPCHFKHRCGCILCSSWCAFIAAAKRRGEQREIRREFNQHLVLLASF